MKIIYDHQIFFLQKYGGVSRYITRLCQGMHTMGGDIRVVAPIHRNYYLDDIDEKILVGIKMAALPERFAQTAAFFNRQISSAYAWKFQPEIVHETYYTSKPVQARGSVRVLTVHDMITELFPAGTSSQRRASALKRLAVDRADHIIAISHCTKQDLCEIFDVPDEKVTVVHHGFETLRRKKNREPEDTIERPFLLFVGKRHWYKNFEGLLSAVASERDLRNTFDIVAFGGPVMGAAEKKRIASLGLRENSVHHLGGDDALLAKLYDQASAFVYPSQYEGFGLPPLEAMSHSCPVIVCKSSAIPEVVGNAGQYFSPNNSEELAHAIRSVVFNDARRKELVDLGHRRLKMFSWDKCVRDTFSVYSSALQGR